jgi:hypothetical protein
MAAVATMAQGIHSTVSELCGIHLGTIERRFGLLSSTTGLRIAVELGRSGDLAAADRIAYVHAVRTGTVTLVVESDGWYAAVVCDEAVTAEQVFAASLDPCAPRLMSIVSRRGIAPVLGALAGQA